SIHGGKSKNFLISAILPLKGVIPECIYRGSSFFNQLESGFRPEACRNDSSGRLALIRKNFYHLKVLWSSTSSRPWALRPDMLGPDPDPDQSGRYPAQQRETGHEPDQARRCE